MPPTEIAAGELSSPKTTRMILLGWALFPAGVGIAQLWRSPVEQLIGATMIVGALLLVGAAVHLWRVLGVLGFTVYVAAFGTRALSPLLGVGASWDSELLICSAWSGACALAFSRLFHLLNRA